MFKIKTSYQISADQSMAVKKICKGFKDNEKDIVLLGVTGSGKTFTMANVIQNLQKSTIILAHNKTLAAQLYEEMKSFFPDNRVEYFVSYYDYYQPEAYIAKTDTFIEKDSSINEKIDRLRHSATRSLLENDHVIVIASISCIYGLGDPINYLNMACPVKVDDQIPIETLKERLIELHYEQTTTNLFRGSFNVKGDVVSIFPSHYENRAWRISYFDDYIEKIEEFDPLTGASFATLDAISVFPNSHYVTPRMTINQTIRSISDELNQRIKEFDDFGKIVESHRIKQRTNFDIEMLYETGTCKGIENYSRYITGRKAGMPPPTLFDYFTKNSLLIIDESHVTVPQIGAMYNGDKARKNSLIEHGFRLPSARDNRPLKFEEWEEIRPITLYVSATPGRYELDQTDGKYVEQIIRPTGLLDPMCVIRPVDNQVDDLLNECHKEIRKGNKVLATTLTKKMAENLTEYMQDVGIKVSYLHSNITTLERIEIIRNLRKGIIDVIVGINLLREGLDIPECGLVAILDADKEGFLRSETALIQTIGRAARNVEGRVILYADTITKSIKRALAETERRRKIQEKYNIDNNIVPKTVNKVISGAFNEYLSDVIDIGDNETNIADLIAEMHEAAEELNFEKAIEIRNKINIINKNRNT
ncbi:excinuclease ABC subunit UvrB [Anaplasmataceae bacterium AB001_6]|nr:excinuclease ABC subunit UvrB [Anaplasmataceae bacterium AB001_6]